MVGLSAFPMMAAAGLAVDLTRIYLVRSRLVTAIDAAALAGGRAISEPTRDDQMRRWFWANFTRPDPGRDRGYLGATVTQLAITQNIPDGTLRIEASATLPTTLMRIFGQQTMTANATNVVRRQVTGLELSLVLDVTGSMTLNNAIGGMRVAANDLVDIVYDGRDTVPNLSVAVVPFTAMVNIGPSRQSWLQGGSLGSRNYTPSTWFGCVEARWQNRNDENDAPPADARFTPFYYASTDGVFHHSVDGDNDWERDRVAELDPASLSALLVGISNSELSAVGLTRARATARPLAEADQQRLDRLVRGPNAGCPRAIRPLTESRATVKAEIDRLRASANRNGTMINLGLQMGWATLSPRWRGAWDGSARPIAYGTPNMRKALVLMSDGDNKWFDNPFGAPGYCDPDYCSRHYWSDNGDADYTAYGRLRQNRLELPSISDANATTEINARMARLCGRIKASGIVVYTVLLNNPAAATQDLMRNCATSPSHYYYSPDNAALRTAFQRIGQQLSSLRLVQ